MSEKTPDLNLTPITLVAMVDERQLEQNRRELLRMLFPDGDLDRIIELLQRQRDAIRRADEHEAALDAAEDAEEEVTAVGARPVQPLRIAEADDAQWSAPESSAAETQPGLATVGEVRRLRDENAKLKAERDAAVQTANLVIARAQKAAELTEELISGQLDKHFDIPFVAAM